LLTGGLLLALACHVPAYGQEPPKPAAPGAPGQTPGAPGQASGAPGQPPGTPGQQPPAQPPGVPAQPTPPPIATPVPVIPPLPETAPVPVIPDVQLIPSPNVPSAPERVLPAPTSRAVPTARFQIDPTISVREEYSDNFFLTERNRKSNFRSTVAPGVDVTINSAFVKGLVTYEFAPSYDTEPDDFSFFHSLLGQVVWEVTPRWKLTLADTFTRSDEPAEADQLGLRQQRSAFTSNTLLAASDYLISTVATRQAYRYSTFSDDFGETKSHTVSLSATVPLLQVNSLSGGYEYLSSTSTGTNVITPGTALTTADESDVTGHRFTAGATRRLHALQTVGVTTSYALRTVSQPIGDSDFQIWNASTFTDYELPGRLRLNVTLGVLGVQTDTGDDVGPKLSTKSSLTYQFARAVATLAVDRGVSETFSEGENFGLVATEGVTASLSYPFTPSLTGLISGHYRHNKTVDVGAIGTTPQQNDESENWGGTVSLTWLIRRNLRFELSYTYTQQVGLGDRQTGATSGQFGGSFGSDNTYTENKVRAAVNLTF
jgi:hypothetical protein